MIRHVVLGLMCAVVLASACGGLSASDFADELVDCVNPGYAPYDDPTSILGEPAALIYDPGFPPYTPPGTYHCSMVYPAQNTAPDGSKLILTLKQGGSVTVRFDPPVYDDPENWDGKDFMVFGNSMFTANGTAQENTNMEEFTIKNGVEGVWEPMTVSVSQDGVNWFTYADGPYADDFAPSQAFAWDWIEDTWGPRLDPTRPVPACLGKADFGFMSVAQAIDAYADSAGGTAFDLAPLDLPADPVTGLKWVQYVRVTADQLDEDEFAVEGEVDAFARVGHAVPPVRIGEARSMPDGARVTIQEAVVTAAAYETGRFCYIEHEDRSGGIRLMGRVLQRGDKVGIHGVVATVDGEKAIMCTAVDPPQGSAPFPTGAVSPVGMPARAVAGKHGLAAVGLVVRTWGVVLSADSNAGTFTIDDGSGHEVKCTGPRLVPSQGDPPNPTNPDWGVACRPEFVPPDVGDFVVVTGICSLEQTEGGVVPLVRLRDQEDLQIM